MSPKKELEIFKTQINLAEYACDSFGFCVDKRKSVVNSKFIRSEGEKLVVARNNTTGHYMYFSVVDNNDKGTIIDFIQNRTSDNFAQIRLRLRSYLKQDHPAQKAYEIKPTARDNKHLPGIYQCIESYEHCPYLQHRDIEQETYNHIHFRDRIKYNKEEVFFPLFSSDGLVGISIYRNPKTKKGVGKKLYKGSEKGVWFSYQPDGEYNFLITESPVDNLSYQQMYGGNHWHVATMGVLTKTQIDTIKLAVGKVNKPVVLGFDNDQKGNEYSEQLSKELHGIVPVTRHIPKAKDWNDDLSERATKEFYAFLDSA